MPAGGGSSAFCRSRRRSCVGVRRTCRLASTRARRRAERDHLHCPRRAACVFAMHVLRECDFGAGDTDMNTRFGFSRRVLIGFLFGIMSLVLMHGAQAQAYPSRPVRVVIPYPPGAVGDIMVRTVGQRLMEILGQPFIIDNRAGGGGLAATEFVAKSTPDGHTLLFNGPNHVTNLGLYANVPYDPVADFVPITHVASAQTVLVAHASTGLKTVQQLVDAAVAKPMALN